MLCCSVTEDPIKPLDNGNAHKPRFFRNLYVKSLPMTEKDNTCSLYGKSINRDMREKSRQIVICLDNATFWSHNQDFVMSNRSSFPQFRLLNYALLIWVSFVPLESTLSNLHVYRTNLRLFRDWTLRRKKSFSKLFNELMWCHGNI